MRVSRIAPAALGLAAVAFTLPTAARAGDPAEPTSPPEIQVTREHPTAPPIVVPVAGLTAQNAKAVADTLRAMSRAEHLDLSDITPDPEEGTIALRHPAAEALRLVALERIFRTARVPVKRERLEVPGNSHFVLKGPATVDALKQVDRALRAANLFETFTIRMDDEAGELTIVPSAAARKPVRYAAVRSAVAAIGSGHEVADVIWPVTLPGA